MRPDFQRYLRAKRTVDDRALNRAVWDALREGLPHGAQAIEIGCGTGTMVERFQSWGLVNKIAGYIGLDADPESIAAARLAHPEPGFTFFAGDLFEWSPRAAGDLLVASAFLDLVDLDHALPRLGGFLKPGGLAYLPLNFDGVTIFEPAHPLDDAVMAAYHASMDARPTGGHSRTGRKLFQALPAAGFNILGAGASDWIVHPGAGGRYPADEAYFLEHILVFFERSCDGLDGLDDWLAARQGQVEAGELVYVAHQLDFLVRRGHLV